MHIQCVLAVYVSTAGVCVFASVHSRVLCVPVHEGVCCKCVVCCVLCVVCVCVSCA